MPDYKFVFVHLLIFIAIYMHVCMYILYVCTVYTEFFAVCNFHDFCIDDQSAGT